MPRDTTTAETLVLDGPSRLVAHYAPRLHALVRARYSADLARVVDPEDIVQSAFRRFFRQLADPAYAIPAGEDLWLLLVTITLNRLRSAETHHRASKRDLRRTSDAPLVEAIAPSSVAANPEGDLVVGETLDRLAPRYREVVLLRLEGYGVAEIAERLGRSHRTVERLFEEVRQRLGDLLHD